MLCVCVQGPYAGGHVIRLGALCEVCGDPAGLSAGDGLCSCSSGHSVCRLCLRQYVLWTHGLQVGLEDRIFGLFLRRKAVFMQQWQSLGVPFVFPAVHAVDAWPSGGP